MTDRSGAGLDDPLADAEARLLAGLAARLSATRPATSPQQWRIPGRVGGAAEHVLRRRLDASRVREAAVLVPLVQRPGGTTVLLTRRSEALKDHAGQISFPGGGLEEGDAGPAAAALREAEEEVGLAPSHVDVLGFLDTCVTGTGFAVTPVVARVAPFDSLRLDRSEVAEAFEVPLRFLIDPANHATTVREIHGEPVEFFEIAYQQHRIWGATAGIIVSFYEKYSDVFHEIRELTSFQVSAIGGPVWR